MFTPIEIQNTVLKGGMGYNKKDTDAFIQAVLKDYEALYKENLELKDKLSVLSEGIQYYKNMETTLQKALVLAEKTSEETQANAIKKASAIEKEADAKAKLLLADAKNELSRIQAQTTTLYQEYEKFKSQYKRLINSQLDLLESESFQYQPVNVEESDNIEVMEADKTVESMQEVTVNKDELETENPIQTQQADADAFEFLED